jgi:ribosomal protein S18 acetylase RimI-like enzyme
MDNSIRSMKKEDITSCVELIKKSFLTVADEYGFTIENAPRFTAFATTVERINWQYDEGRPMFLYENERGEVVGYYSLLMQENKECELNNLCVSPDFRHKNIGQELLLHGFEIARSAGCKKMNIGIVEENEKLKNWYIGFGAEHIGTQKYDFFPFTCGYLIKEL